MRCPRADPTGCQLGTGCPPVLDGGGAVRVVWQEEAEHAKVVLDGPVLRLGLPVVELTDQSQRLRGIPREAAAGVLGKTNKGCRVEKGWRRSDGRKKGQLPS